jgi:ubiquinone/menaquinone biosynthesis C-methylase UbiE
MPPIDNYLPDVKNQYEAMPYPARDPADESKRLLRTWLDDLPMINHHCFAGRQSFAAGFRVLIAGGGTGDGTIFLAEQLRHTNARIVHLDMSAASLAIARERARLRQLDNIEFIEDSLLNLPQQNLPAFDYINCSGVLHHLSDPDAGLRALRSVLKPDGAIGLMVYASAGRTGVYQMQALMRMVNRDEPDAQRKIAHTRELLTSLPSSNWFKRAEADLYHDHRIDDAGLYDLLLHSQDRAYSVDELFDWLGSDGKGQGHGMFLQFTDVQRGRAPYLPHMVLGAKPPALLHQLRRLPMRQQYAMAELMGGSITMHSLYLTRDAHCVAPYGDADYIPFFFHEPLDGATLAQVFSSNKGQPFALHHQHTGLTVTVNPGRYSPQILRLIDGQRSFAEIFDQFRHDWTGKAAAPDNAALFTDFAESYETLHAIERLLLRHPQSGTHAVPQTR